MLAQSSLIIFNVALILTCSLLHAIKENINPTERNAAMFVQSAIVMLTVAVLLSCSLYKTMRDM